MVTDTEKTNHYLLEIYRSGRFPTATIRAWKQKTLQNYAQAATYFEREDDGLKEIERLTGNSPQAHGYGSANAAIEENLEDILEKINSSVEERVNAAIETGIARITQQYRQSDQANAAIATDLKAQVAGLTATVAQLHTQLSALSMNSPPSNRSTPQTNARNDKKPNERRGPFQKGRTEDRITWTTGLLRDNDWNRTKKDNYKSAFKYHDPEGHKAWVKARMVARHEEMMSKLE